MKLLSYGKKLENLLVTFNNKLIGSEFSTFQDKININDTVLFVCHSEVWGMAKVKSQVFEDDKILWTDKRYQYRAKIDSITFFQDTFKFSEYGIDQIFRDTLGKGWAFKILFTPNNIPFEAEEALNKVINELSAMTETSIENYLKSEIEFYEKQHRKRLGLD